MKTMLVVMTTIALAIVGGAVWFHHHSQRSAAIAAVPNAVPVHHVTAEIRQLSATPIPPWVVQPGAPARRIAGRVVFRGIPVAGAKVQLQLDVVGEMNPILLPEAMSRVVQPIAEQTSAADGTFDFGVQPAAELTVSASAVNFAAVAAAVPNADPTAPSDQLMLELGDCHGRVSGVVADASGGPIARARISIAGFAGTESDAAGNYSLCVAARHGGVGSPANNLRFEADGYGAIREDVLVAGELHLDIKLAPEAILVGRVVTTDGKPVGGARVTATPAPSTNAMRFASGWATADSDGAFRIAGLSPAEFDLSAMAQDLGVAAPLSVVARPAATSRELAVVVEPRAVVRGHIAIAGAPLAGCRERWAHRRR